MISIIVISLKFVSEKRFLPGVVLIIGIVYVIVAATFYLQ